MICETVMTKNPTCCLAADTVTEAAELMRIENVGALPVVDSPENKQLIGIITDRDLAIRVVGLGLDCLNTSVGQVMTPEPVVCHPTDMLAAAMTVMANHQIRRIPVVNGQGEVLGMISQADIAIQFDNSGKVGELIGRISQPEAVIAR